MGKQPFSAKDDNAFHTALIRGKGEAWLNDNPLPSWGARHPAWTLLDAAPTMKARDSARVLEAMLEAGWNPASMQRMAPVTASARQQARWARPIAGNPLQNPSLLARLCGLPPEAGREWNTVLVRRGARPGHQEWETAMQFAAVHLMDGWKALGFQPPSNEELFDHLLHKTGDHTLRFPNGTEASIRHLADAGWRPAPKDWQPLLWEENKELLVGTLACFPEGSIEWGTTEWAQALWAIMEDYQWNYAATTPVEKLIAMLGENPTVRAAWNTLCKPIARGRDRSGKKLLAPAWMHLMTMNEADAASAAIWQIVEPWVHKPIEWQGKTLPEWWAENGSSPDEKAPYGIGPEPNPRTGQWPAALAPLRGIEAWVEAGGGWHKAMTDPRGPLVALAARAVRENDGAMESLILPYLRKIPASRRQQMEADGHTLAEWCAGRPRMAKILAQGEVDPAKAMHAAIKASSIGRVKALAGKQGEHGLSHEAFIETALAVPARKVPGGMERRGKTVEIIRLLRQGGASWPTNPDTWHHSDLFISSGKPGKPSLHPFRHDMATWNAWKGWPAFLAPHWINSAADALGRRAQTAGSDSGVWRSLDEAGEEAAEAVIRALLDACEEDRESKPYRIIREPERWDTAEAMIFIHAAEMVDPTRMAPALLERLKVAGLAGEGTGFWKGNDLVRAKVDALLIDSAMEEPRTRTQRRARL